VRAAEDGIQRQTGSREFGKSAMLMASAKIQDIAMRIEEYGQHFYK
jgi:hypothetical protein